MRDAFGGAFSIRLMLIFLMLYVSFICVAINYARAFRVKNRIINIIEQNEGVDPRGNTDEQIKAALREAGYYVDESEVERVKCDSCTFNSPGYSYKKIKSADFVPEGSSSRSYDAYYYVETYMIFRLPVIDTFLGINFPIAVKGETRVMNFVN